MAFHEKSAWIMTFILLLVGLAYFYIVAVAGSEPGQLAQPMAPRVIVYTICLVVLSVVGHTAIAIMAPRDANAPLDERERTIVDRAGHYSSYVVAIGIVLSLGLYMLSHDGDLLFYTVFASLMIGQIMEYAFQILLYRTSV